MIIEYHRPDSLPETLALLARTEVRSMPLGGGTVMNQPSPDPVAAIDLQSLGLNTLKEKGKKIEIGATVTLQQMLDFTTEQAMKAALQHEATYNIRQVATIAGRLVAANGRSPFTTAMLALEAELDILPDDEKISLGNYLPLRQQRKSNHLITHISIPNNVGLAYEYVARTPADLPIVCVAVAQWPSGRTRVALGGYGKAPLLAMDGPEPDGADSAARDAYREAGDQWASAEYRSDVAGALVLRCLNRI
jgi:CO/xanthine dehydrogenase FAD-binding subunit